MKIILPALCCCLFNLSASAQQLPLFTQYREYAGILNPGSVPHDYLVYDQNLSFGASYRRQWINDQDGPATQMVRADYLWLRGNVNPIFGAYLMNDKAARVGTTGAYTRIGMMTGDAENGFSAGLSAGVVRYGLNLMNARLDDATDPLLTGSVRARIAPDVGAGVFGHATLSGNLLYGGVSVPQILGWKLSFNNASQEVLSIRRTQHYYALAGYKIALEDENFLEFSSWVRFIPALKPNFDLNMRFQMHQAFYIGTGLNSARMAHFESGLTLGTNSDRERLVRIGLGADLSFAKTNAFYGNSIEVNCAICLKKD